MYKLSIKQWNPFQGCLYDCIYCEKSFKAQAKRQKHNCIKCYNYIPHEHPERLNSSLPKTQYLQFIFTVASGDISFCTIDYLKQIITKIKQESDKTFLIQSKNPKAFNRVEFPNNVILGTTIETNRDELYNKYKLSNAPLPSKRYKGLLKINHSLKMVTIEPILDFDRDILLKWVDDTKPVMVWIGYDSKGNVLPSPSVDKVKDFYWQLGKKGFTVMLKTIREKETK